MIPRTAQLWIMSLVLQSDAQLVRLFVNDRATDQGVMAGDFIEPLGGGYAPARMVAADWRVAVAQKLVVASGRRQVFKLVGPVGPVYGYFVTMAKSGQLLLAERFAEPFTLQDGGTVAVTPRFDSAAREAREA